MGPVLFGMVLLFANAINPAIVYHPDGSPSIDNSKVTVEAVYEFND